MAEIVGVFAVSHTPVMTNMPDAPGATHRDAAFAQYKRVGDEIGALAPDAVVLISNDHLHNFYLDNLPAFCVGIAPDYWSPAEGWLKVPRQVLPGAAALGSHLLGELLEAGFDPAFSMKLTLDHGMLTPLDLAGLAGVHPLVPVMINAVQPPMPTMQRCVALGIALRAAIASFTGVERVVVLATGGLSHDVGTPRMGQLNEAFDRDFLAALEGGGAGAAVEIARTRVDTAGNGAEEVRNWLVAHGIARCGTFETYYYRGMAEWYTGIALGRWRLTA